MTPKEKAIKYLKIKQNSLNKLESLQINDCYTAIDIALQEQAKQIFQILEEIGFILDCGHEKHCNCYDNFKSKWVK